MQSTTAHPVLAGSTVGINADFYRRTERERLRHHFAAVLRALTGCGWDTSHREARRKESDLTAQGLDVDAAFRRAIANGTAKLDRGARA